jgi:hypothetical protein
MTALELFRDGDKPVLRPSVVLYLDVLGTSAASTSPQRQASLEKLDVALRAARDAAMARGDDEMQALTWFTDNVFVAWPLQE